MRRVEWEASMYRRIRELREDQNITQTKMAQILHCSQQVYSNYELGQRDIPTELLINIAKFHNTTTDYLLGLTDFRGIPKEWDKKAPTAN